MLAALVSKGLVQTAGSGGLCIARVIPNLDSLAIVLERFVAFALKIGNMPEVDIGPHLHGWFGGTAFHRAFEKNLRLFHIVRTACDQSQTIKCCSIGGVLLKHFL